MLLRISLSTIELLKLSDLVSGGYDFVITLLRYGGVSSTENDKEEAFSFLTISSTSERVRRVTGFWKASDECFVMTGSLGLTGVTFCASWPLLDVVVGRAGVSTWFVWLAINQRIYHWVSCNDIRNGMRREIVFSLAEQTDQVERSEPQKREEMEGLFWGSNLSFNFSYCATWSSSGIHHNGLWSEGKL